MSSAKAVAVAAPVPSATSLEPSGPLCILEPICLDQFIFSPCPHAEIACLRHRYESLADSEGARAYGEAAWRKMKLDDPVALVQMIDEVRSRETLLGK